MEVMPINFGVIEIIFDRSERSRSIQRHLLAGGSIRVVPECVRKGTIDVAHCAIVF